MYEPKVGDEITFVMAEVNRNIVYTVTEVGDRWIVVTTPAGFVLKTDDLFTYSLSVKQFRSLGPRRIV